MGAVEGGIRVPGIVRWPEVTTPGLEIDSPTSLVSLLIHAKYIMNHDNSALIHAKPLLTFPLMASQYTNTTFFLLYKIMYVN